MCSKALVILALFAVITQEQVDALIDLGNRAEEARIEQFWKDLQCTRVLEQHTSMIVCIKDLEIFVLKEPI